MKLATLKTQDKDGCLLIVNQQLTSAIEVNNIAPNLQAALENWEKVSPKLEELSSNMNEASSTQVRDYNPTELTSPLPRAYQWADGSAYVNHVELVRKARGAEMPKNFWTDPLMYQGGSDKFIGPTDPIEIADESWGVDFESEIAVITDEVPMGTPADEADKHIKLIMLVNDVSLRNLIPNEIGKGFGFFHSKPATAFSPVAVTPDELGTAWKDGKVHLPLVTHLNQEQFGAPNAGVDMTFNFPALIAHAAKTRHLSAGTIIGSGTVSNLDRSLGSSCIAEKRMLEKIETGEMKTPFMKYGDSVQIEMFDDNQQSIFGAISQIVQPYKR